MTVQMGYWNTRGESEGLCDVGINSSYRQLVVKIGFLYSLL